MKVNFDELIYEVDGTVLSVSIPDKEDLDFVNKNGFYKTIGTKKQTIKDFCISALNFVDKEQGLEQSLKQASIIKQIRLGGEVELKSEEISEIKKLCAKIGVTPIVLVQIDHLLEGKENPFKPN